MREIYEVCDFRKPDPRSLYREGIVNLMQNFSYLGRIQPAPIQTINDLKPPACPKNALKSVKLTIPFALTVQGGVIAMKLIP